MASRSIPKARCSANRPFGRSRRLPSNRPPTAPSRTCGTSSIACAAAARPTPPSGPPWRLRAPRIWPTPPGARRRSGRPDRFPVCRRGPPCPGAPSHATMDFMLAFRLALAVCSLSAFAAEAPKLRLPDDIRPIQYAADLTLVPGDKTFAGGCKPPPPGQYASPRSATGAALYFQSNSPVSGTSAYTPSGPVTYITPAITIGTASEPGFPMRNVHPSFSCSTLLVLICRKEEYRIAPGSLRYSSLRQINTSNVEQ